MLWMYLYEGRVPERGHGICGLEIWWLLDENYSVADIQLQRTLLGTAGGREWLIRCSYHHNSASQATLLVS